MIKRELPAVQTRVVAGPRRVRDGVVGLGLCFVLAWVLGGCSGDSAGAAADAPSTAPRTGEREAAAPDATEPATPPPTPAATGSTAATGGPAVVVGPVGPLAVDVADDPAERAVGLMGRATVPDGTGMVFLYDEPVRNGFWMANVQVPLSIAWSLDGAVVGVGEMQPCPQADSTCPLYLPADPDAVFDVVVETAGGTFTDAGVSVGDPVQLIGVRPS